MTNEELEHGSFEIENRIRNLMWTISGDYDLDTKPDVTSFYKSKYISIYDAIKQGAFSRFFDKDAFALYLLKKVYLGADESQLVTLGQICVEAACHDKIAKERPGVPDIRKKAFEAIMDHDFEKMLDTYTGKVKLAYMREALTGSAPADSRVIRPFEQLKRLEQAQKTEELVQAVDWFYNQMVDPTFEKRVGDLEKVLSVSTEELSGFDWQDFLDENATEASLEEMMRQANSSTLPEDEEEAEEKKHRAGKILITEEDIKKMYSYIELHFGTSYMDAREQERLNRRICRGIHADCKLYFTEGILKGCVRENNTYVLAKRTTEMN